MHGRKRVPESLSGYGEQQDIHPLDKLCIRKVRSHRTDRTREVMALEILWVFVVFIEIVNDALFTGPHKNFVIRISEVVRETRSKVSCAEY
jgi:hypothetical protein